MLVLVLVLVLMVLVLPPLLVVVLMALVLSLFRSPSFNHTVDEAARINVDFAKTKEATGGIRCRCHVNKAICFNTLGRWEEMHSELLVAHAFKVST